MGDIICISHLRWDFVWQRPQHLLSRFSQDNRILFVEEPIIVTSDDAQGQNHKELAPHLEVFPGKGAENVTVVRMIFPQPEACWIGHGDPRTQETYSRLLSEYLTKHDYNLNKAILWLYTPMASAFAQTIPHSLLVVDVMDQLSAFKGAPAELILREENVLRQADIVFTGGASLYRDKQPFNPNTFLFPSGVDVDHFAQAATRCSADKVPDLDHIPGPILGYYGVIDERMDLDMLAYVAQERPEWNVVLVGPITKISPEDLPQAPNLHYVGMKTYEQLPDYLSRFDVALIPFALCDATRFLSPTKTLEYMAAHKPIVSTPINDVLELYGDVVHVAYKHHEFVNQIEAAMAEDPASRWALEHSLLERNTWDSIATRMTDIIRLALAQAANQRKPKTKTATKAA